MRPPLKGEGVSKWTDHGPLRSAVSAWSSGSCSALLVRSPVRHRDSAPTINFLLTVGTQWWTFPLRHAGGWCGALVSIGGGNRARSRTGAPDAGCRCGKHQLRGCRTTLAGELDPAAVSGYYSHLDPQGLLACTNQTGSRWGVFSFAALQTEACNAGICKNSIVQIVRGRCFEFGHPFCQNQAAQQLITGWGRDPEAPGCANRGRRLAVPVVHGDAPVDNGFHALSTEPKSAGRHERVRASSRSGTRVTPSAGLQRTITTSSA